MNHSDVVFCLVHYRNEFHLHSRDRYELVGLKEGNSGRRVTIVSWFSFIQSKSDSSSNDFWQLSSKRLITLPTLEIQTDPHLNYVCETHLIESYRTLT